MGKNGEFAMETTSGAVEAVFNGQEKGEKMENDKIVVHAENCELLLKAEIKNIKITNKEEKEIVIKTNLQSGYYKSAPRLYRDTYIDGEWKQKGINKNHARDAVFECKAKPGDIFNLTQTVYKSNYSPDKNCLVNDKYEFEQVYNNNINKVYKKVKNELDKLNK